MPSATCSCAGRHRNNAAYRDSATTCIDTVPTGGDGVFEEVLDDPRVMKPASPASCNGPTKTQSLRPAMSPCARRLHDPGQLAITKTAVPRISGRSRRARRVAGLRARGLRQGPHGAEHRRRHQRALLNSSPSAPASPVSRPTSMDHRRDNSRDAASTAISAAGTGLAHNNLGKITPTPAAMSRTSPGCIAACGMKSQTDFGTNTLRPLQSSAAVDQLTTFGPIALKATAREAAAA